MEKNILAPGIISFENVISDPINFINSLEDSVNSKKIYWFDASQSDGGVESESQVVKSARNCKAISIPNYDNATNVSEDNFLYTIHKELNKYLNPLLDEYCNEYNAPHWKLNEGWQLLKYGSDNYFINHYDDSKQYPRTMSMSFYLNDDYEGGEIEFSRFNLKIKPKANQAIFFPANYVYNHTVHPVISGTRYAVVGWWE